MFDYELRLWVRAVQVALFEDCQGFINLAVDEMTADQCELYLGYWEWVYQMSDIWYRMNQMNGDYVEILA